MTNRIAISLCAILLAALVLDMLRNDMSGTVFVARKLLELIEYLAFWR